MEVLFWFCTFLVVYVYMGYPMLVKLLSKVPNKILKNDEHLPSVSILIAAYNEEQDIAYTLQNKIELDYPIDRLEILVVSDESEDRTDEIVTQFAEKTPINVRLIRQSPRAGKTSGLNLLVPEANGEILVFSDANSIYEERALKSLVRNFNDPNVGYVTGKMVYTHKDGSLVADGCSSYMKYENWLRKGETRIGSIVGVDGGIDAMRRELYEPLRADQLPDFVQPLKVVEKGYRVVYEPDALLKEEALDEPGREYNMRVRVSLRALWAMHDMHVLLNPLKFGKFAIQLISHKLLRYLAFVPLVLCFFTNLVLFSESSVYLITILIQVVFYSLAWLGMLNQGRADSPVYFTLPYYFSLLNIACAHATWRYLKGEKQVTWKPRAG